VKHFLYNLDNDAANNLTGDYLQNFMWQWTVKLKPTTAKHVQHSKISRKHNSSCNEKHSRGHYHAKRLNYHQNSLNFGINAKTLTRSFISKTAPQYQSWKTICTAINGCEQMWLKNFLKAANLRKVRVKKESKLWRVQNYDVCKTYTISSHP